MHLILLVCIPLFVIVVTVVLSVFFCFFVCLCLSSHFHPFSPPLPPKTSLFSHNSSEYELCEYDNTETTYVFMYLAALCVEIKLCL